MMTISIRRPALVADGACEQGLALFDALKRHQDEQRARHQTLYGAKWSRDKAPPKGWKAVPASCPCCATLAKDGE